MVNCSKYIGGVGYTILNLITMGSMIALISMLLYIFDHSSETISYNSLRTGLIITLVIFIVIFVFSTFAGFSSNRSLKCFLATIYIFFTIYIVLNIIVLFAITSSLTEFVSREFNDNPDFASSFEQYFDCKYWDEPALSERTCKEAYEATFSKAQKIIAIILIICSIFLIVGIVFAFKRVCCEKRSDGFQSYDTKQSNPAIMYGW